MTERTRVDIRNGRIVKLKVCIECGQEKVCDVEPFTEFHVERKWPDGRPRDWRSRCKGCYRAHVLIANQSPARQKRRRQLKRDYWRRKRRALRQQGSMPQLPVALFAEWLAAYMRACGYVESEPCAFDLGIVPRRVREYLSGNQAHVAYDVVDRALMNANTFVDVRGITIFTISDLYGDHLDERMTA